MTHDLEFAQIEVEVVNGLKKGNEALKKVHDALDISEIEKILEETREGAEKQDEINALLSGALTEEDEEAVEAELDEIIQQQLPDIPPAETELPEVPTTPVEGNNNCFICMRCLDLMFCRENEGEKKRTARGCCRGSISLYSIFFVIQLLCIVYFNKCVWEFRQIKHFVQHYYFLLL